MKILDLPNELLCYMVRDLPPWDMANLGQVCRRFRMIANERYYWSAILRNAFPHHPHTDHPKQAYVECMKLKNHRFKLISFPKETPYTPYRIEYIGYDRILRIFYNRLSVFFLKKDRTIDIDISYRSASNICEHSIAYLKDKKIYIHNFDTGRKSRVNIDYKNYRLFLTSRYFIIQESEKTIKLYHRINRQFFSLEIDNIYKCAECNGKLLLHTYKHKAYIYDIHTLNVSLIFDLKFLHRDYTLYKQGVIFPRNNETEIHSFEGHSIVMDNWYFISQHEDNLIFLDKVNKQIHYWNMSTKEIIDSFDSNYVACSNNYFPKKYLDKAKHCFFPYHFELARVNNDLYILGNAVLDFNISEEDYKAHIKVALKNMIESVEAYVKHNKHLRHDILEEYFPFELSFQFSENIQSILSDLADSPSDIHLDQLREAIREEYPFFEEPTLRNNKKKINRGSYAESPS